MLQPVWQPPKRPVQMLALHTTCSVPRPAEASMVAFPKSSKNQNYRQQQARLEVTGQVIDKPNSLGRKRLGKEICGRIRAFKSSHVYEGTKRATYILSIECMLKKCLKKTLNFHLWLNFMIHSSRK